MNILMILMLIGAFAALSIYGKDFMKFAKKFAIPLVAFGGVALLMTGAIVIPGQQIDVQNVGTITAKVHDGYSNTTTTEDYVNLDKDQIKFLSADANIADGEEYKFNITIGRTIVEKAGGVMVTCQANDQEISGITADNLIEKTNGQIDLDINNDGDHVDDNTVEKLITFAEGVATAEAEIAFDQEETYHDGMTDIQDEFYVNCKVGNTEVRALIVANS